MLKQIVEVIAEKFASLDPVLNVRARRLWVAAEADAIGRGGITRVAICSRSIGPSAYTSTTTGATKRYRISPLHRRFRILRMSFAITFSSAYANAFCRSFVKPRPVQ
jgi:hypothetical protein